jgi:Arc/MetJ-type ribon-helix-helix transcriptional regulator
MKDQFTVRLPRELSQAVRRAARRTQRRPSEVVRMALREYLEIGPTRARRPAERVVGLLGSLETGIPDLAERHRAYILESLKHAR